MTAQLTRQLALGPTDGWVNMRSGITKGPELVRGKSYFFTFEESTKVYVIESYPAVDPVASDTGHPAVPGEDGFYFTVPSDTQGEIFARVADRLPAVLHISAADPAGDGSAAP